MGLSTILPGVLLLGIVIFVHELGHFLAAKWRGVRVVKFSLGMGPEMIGFSAGETRYCLSWIPLGGFVQMAGDSLNEDGTMPAGGAREFLTHPWYGRIAIALAGPLANVVLAFVTFTTLFVIGVTGPDYPNVLGTLPDSTAAHRAGLREGDRVARLAGQPIETWRGIEQAYGKRDTNAALVIGVARDSGAVEIAVAPADVDDVMASIQPPSIPSEIGSVITGLPAYRGGLREGDRVIAVDGVAVSRFEDLSPQLRGKAGRSVQFRVIRGQRTFDVDVTPIRDEGSADSGRALVGIEPPRGMTWTMRLPWQEAVPAALRQTAATTLQVYDGLWKTVTRFWQYREQMGGPIFIAQMARDAARKGLDYWLNLMATINIAIMAFNLMPIPLLDGGHIVIALLQAVRRRALSGRAYLNFQKVGLAVVGTLFIFILSQDILRPFQRRHALGQAPRESSTVAPAPR